MGKQDYSVSKHLLTVKYVPGTALDMGHKAGKQGDTFFALMELTIR